MRLTAKQRRFAELVASGEGLGIAYASAYDCKDSSPHTIAVNASRLVRVPKVAAYIEHLNEAAAHGSIATRAALVSRLWSVNSKAYADITDQGGADAYRAVTAFLKTSEQLVRMGALPAVRDDEQALDELDERERGRAFDKALRISFGG